jgi:hypothetical protein
MSARYAPVAQIEQLLSVALSATDLPYPASHASQSDDASWSDEALPDVVLPVAHGVQSPSPSML